jgi:O-antigen/teichoic acid export membrane protein
VVCAVATSKAVESISDVLYGTMQRHERMDLIGRSMIVKGVLSLSVFSGALLWTRSVFWASAGLAAAWTVVLLGYDGPVAARVGSRRRGVSALESLLPRFASEELRALLAVAFPLGLVALLISLNTNVPRYVLEHQSGVASLGVFAALTYLMVGGGTVVGALGQAASPRLANLFAAGDLGGFRKVLAKLLILVAGLSAAGVAIAVVAGRPILLLLYRPEYAAASGTFVWIAIASGIAFVASILGYTMTAAQIFRPQLPLFLLVTAVTATGSVALVPPFGMKGGAWALLAGAVVQLLGATCLDARCLARGAAQLE